MFLSDYQADLLKVIQYFIDAGWATGFEFSVDARSKTIAYNIRNQKSL